MSRNGPPDYHDNAKCPKPSSVELTIQTLMGTSFEIKVSSHDTITEIKNKIQTTEGIPSSQQHLLFNGQELDDNKRLCSYPISSGTTLKLIVSMRVGPISTKRTPEVDELAWRELQELISDTPKDDLINRLPPKTRLTVLIYQEGEQVNFVKVLENEDGTFSPLSDDWNGSSFRTLFSRTNASPEDSESEESSVTMGKVQELQERLEALSIHKRDRRFGELIGGRSADATIASRTFGSKTDSRRSVRVVSYLAGGLQHQSDASRMFYGREGHAGELDMQRTRALLPSLLCPKMLVNKNRIKKEVEKLTQVYKPKKGSGSESGSGSGLKRPPLPEIRRSSPSDKDKAVREEEHLDDKLREKTATGFAIVEEENAASSGPVCSSQSSAAALPGSDEAAAAVASSPTSADRVTPVMTRGIYRLPNHLLQDKKGKGDGAKGAGSGPGKGANRGGRSSAASKQNSYNYSRLFRRLSHMVPVSKMVAVEDQDTEFEPEQYTRPLLRNLPKMDEPIEQPVVKKRVRCTECKKKLNITNTYYCRCGDGPFCGDHRYSEAHDCAIDYRLQGRRVIRKANPVVAPSKLPRI